MTTEKQASPQKHLTLRTIYEKLYAFYGPQYWWPGDTPFEMTVGAILTQNTNWANVEKAIDNLKVHDVMNSRALHKLPLQTLAALIRPSGYYNIKAKRIRAFLNFLFEKYGGSVGRMKTDETRTLRKELLAINGIGPETADSILLYALEKPVFVIDAYTRRIFSRHDIIDANVRYDEYQDFFHCELDQDVHLFNEYHALLVRVGKEYCRTERRCERCPLSVLQ